MAGEAGRWVGCLVWFSTVVRPGLLFMKAETKQDISIALAQMTHDPDRPRPRWPTGLVAHVAVTAVPCVTCPTPTATRAAAPAASNAPTDPVAVSCPAPKPKSQRNFAPNRPRSPSAHRNQYVPATPQELVHATSYLVDELLGRRPTGGAYAEPPEVPVAPCGQQLARHHLLLPPYVLPVWPSFPPRQLRLPVRGLGRLAVCRTDHEHRGPVAAGNWVVRHELEEGAGHIALPQETQMVVIQEGLGGWGLDVLHAGWRYRRLRLEGYAGGGSRDVLRCTGRVQRTR